MTQELPDTPCKLVPGNIIGGRYRVIGQIGYGSMGTVYRCEQVALEGRLVALKLLWPHLVKKRDFIERFRREVICCYDVSHPNVVRAYDFFEEGENVGFSMELVEGGELRGILNQGGLRGLQDSYELFCGIAQGLAAIHSKGIVHRDLKPENILLSTDGTPKITDFGIARLPYHKPVTPRGNVLGTFFYIAPETLNGAEATKLSDLYSLGMIGYELLFARLPFAGLSLYEQLELKKDLRVPDLRQTPTEQQVCMLDVVRQLLAPDPTQRLQSADEVLAGLIPPAPPVPTRNKHKFEQRLWVIPGAMLLFLVIGLLYLKESPLKPTSLAKEEQRQSLGLTPALFPDLEIRALPTQPPTVVPLQPTIHSTRQLQQTKLRILKGPIGDWEKGQVLYLTGVRLELYNAGSYDANDVKVVVTIPGGKEIELSGPKTIVRNKRAEYFLSLRESIFSHGTLKASVSCSNCR